MNLGAEQPQKLLMTRATWLKHHEFEFDPFEYEAADDIPGGDPYLDRYFVTFPYFESLKQPRTTFLFTRRGCGKSANAIQLERWCQRTLRHFDQEPNVLAVRHDDFLRVLAQLSPDQPQQAIDGHVQAILYRSVPELLQALFSHLPPDTIGELPPRQREDLAWFVQHYSDRLFPASLKQQLKAIQGPLPPLSPDQWPEALKGVGKAVTALLGGSPVQAISEAVNTIATLFRYEFEETDFAKKMTPLELLSRFRDVAHACELDAVFVLVDRVDEFYGTADRPEKQVDLLAPLIDTLPLLGTLNFKFFLPSELLPFLQGLRGDRLRVLREDKLPVFEVAWRSEEIRQLLQTRLKEASQRRRSRFAELVESEDERWDVDDLLVKFAHGSPRDLVRLCRRMFDEHTRVPTDRLYILDTEVQEAIRWFSRVRARELYGDEWLAQLIRLQEMPFTFETAIQTLKLPEEKTEALLQEWQEKGLVKHLPRDPAQPEVALLFDIADPRVRLVWEEEHL